MKKHRVLALVALLLGVVLVSAACAGSPAATPVPAATAAPQAAATAAPQAATAAPAAPAASAAPASKYPLTQNKETLSVFAISTDKAKDDNYTVKWYEDLTNVHIDWKQVPGDDYKTKMNLLVASGEPVDIIAIPNLGVAKPTFTEVYRLAKQGLLAPLNDIIAKNNPNYTRILADYPELKKVMTAPDGNMYGFGIQGTCYHCSIYNKLWFNNKWVENLGMKTPTTTDEFAEVLRAFKTKDPNKNGKQDEIPMATFAKGNSYTKIEVFLMNSFVFYDSQAVAGRLYVDNGTVKCSMLDPNFKEGLKYIAGLYKEGLIYPDSFTMEQKDLKAINEGGTEAMIGAIPGPHGGYVGNTGTSNRWFEYGVLPPLKGPNGLQITANHDYTLIEPTVFITTQCKKPELAAQWLDGFFTGLDDQGLTLVYGEKDVAWKYPDAGEVGSDGKPALYQSLKVPETNPYFGNMSIGINLVITTFFHSNQRAPKDIYAADLTGFERWLYTETEKYEPYRAPIDMQLPNLYFDEKDINEISKIKADLDTFMNESIAKFVTGAYNLDADYDKFQADLKTIGVDNYVSLTQKTLDAWKAGQK